MAHPDPVILQALATFNAGIMPEKLLMAAPGATLDEKSKAFADHPIGSGPFVLTSWKRNTEMVMTRNPYYWKPAADGKRCPTSTPSASSSSRTTRPACSSCAPASWTRPSSCRIPG